MIADAVVALPGSEPLDNLLLTIHTNRLGHVARVVSGHRKAPLCDQLRRAGVPLDRAPEFSPDDRVLLIFAAALSERCAALLLRHGAARAWQVSRGGVWTEQQAMPRTSHIPFAVSEATTGLSS